MLTLAAFISTFTSVTPSAWSETATTPMILAQSTSPNCSDPGPSTVSESALCQMADETSSARAESLLTGVLVLICLGALVALKLWR